MSEPARPIITADLAVLGATAGSSAALRDEHVWPVVVDANVLIEDLLWNANPEKHPSALLSALAVNSIRLLGKLDVIDEVLEHLSDVAGDREVEPLVALLAERYVPQLRLVDISGITLPDAEDRITAVAAADVDDEPSARLAHLLDPCVLLTRDHHLTDHGFGTWYEPGGVRVSWTAAAFTLYDRSFETQVTSGIRGAAMAASVPGMGVVGLVRAARRHPRVAVSAAIVGGALLLLARSSSRWVPARERVWNGFARMTSEISQRIETNRLPAALTAKGQLADYREAHPGPGTAEAILARHLAIAPPRGIAARDLYEITGRRFAVRPVLEAHPAFWSDSEGRWHLGVAAQMPAS